MNAAARTRFDLEALRALAGEKVFARGQVYHRDGQVELLAVEPGRVLAQVAGTEDYQTELTGFGDAIGGACSCPAFEDRGFCKHMVATALAANAVSGEGNTEGVGALSRIRDHLMQRGLEALVEMVTDLAARDAALFRRLDMAATMASADPRSLVEGLRKSIDGATRARGFIDYRRAPAWAGGVDDALDGITELISAGHAALALGLAERAIDRIEAAIPAIDDSDGYCGGLLERAGAIHLAAAGAARPEPIRLARQLFVREMKGDYDTFHGAVWRYGEVLGEPGLAEYRRLAAEAWAKLPPRSRAAPNTYLVDGGHERLIGILDFFADRDGDIDARIALRAEDLSSPWRYLKLAEFCLAQGREAQALRYAEDGLWVFEDARPDARLVTFAAALLVKAGRVDDAEAALWRAFEKAPSLELYQRLRELAGETARERAIEQLRVWINGGQSINWRHPGDLVVEILALDGAFDAAWLAVGQNGASMTAREDLARASEATHPRQAIDVYTERIDQLVDGGGDQAYKAAIKLLGHLATLRSADDQASHVEALKARFSRKRNFMKRLA